MKIKMFLTKAIKAILPYGVIVLLNHIIKRNNNVKSKKLIGDAYNVNELIQSAKKINIGAGKFFAPGWTNLDYPSTWYASMQIYPFIPYDIRNDALPFANESIEAVYSSHVIEHIEIPHVQRLFNETYRVLKEGGVFRVCCPDAEFLYTITQKYPLYWNWTENWYKNFGDPNTPPPKQLDFLVQQIATPHNRQYIDRYETLSYEELENNFNILPMENFLDYLGKGLSFRDSVPRDHISWFSYDKLRNMLISAGFYVIRSKYGGAILPEMQNTKIFDRTHPRMTLYVDAIKE